MEIALAISKGGGNIGKPLFGFPWFPRAVISTALRFGCFLPRDVVVLRIGRESEVCNVYTLRYSVEVGEDIDFEWDDENTQHVAAHQVTPAEVEFVLTHDPLDLDYEWIDDEERYRSVGPTVKGRLLSVVWTVRDGRIRVVTAFAASVSDKKAYWEMSR